MMKTQDVSLKTMQGGAAVELFDNHLRKVAADVIDRNTDAEAARSVTLTVTVKPDIKREAASVNIKVQSKMAPARQEEAFFFFGVDADGNAVVTEREQTQQELPFDGGDDDAETNNSTGENVHDIKEAKP
jgi:hypothetical protein